MREARLCRILIWTVLGGELAVPCNPQSAKAGPNSHRRSFVGGDAAAVSGVEGWVPRNENL